MTTPDQPSPEAQFSNTVVGLPINYADARLLAHSSCAAFRQNPGTLMVDAAGQLAGQRGWTTAQAMDFLIAATNAYCPEYRNGS